VQTIMMTLRLFQRSPTTIPSTCAWRLAELGEARGRQESVVKQSPQRLQALRETAMIDSTLSAFRLDDLEIGPERVQAIVATAGPLPDRTEREIRGYHRALGLIHGEGPALSISEETIRLLHDTLFSDAADAGVYRHGQSDLAALPPDRQLKVRWQSVAAANVPVYVEELVRQWRNVLSQQAVHPFIAMAGFELDFLCIGPFQYGVDRVARLLSLLLSYHVGFDVGRYISFERLIEQDRERWQEVFRISSLHWEQGTHDPWPYVDYVLDVLTGAYKEFQSPVEAAQARKGAKTEMVLQAIQSQTDEFKLVDIERLCPSVGRDLIRSLLANLRAEGELTCKGRGPAARWRRSEKNSPA
jgi:Fic family protein